MSYSEKQIRQEATPIIEPLNELLTWRWEDSKNMLLSEFASGKAERVLNELESHFTHGWDKDSIKYVPNSIKEELGDITKLTKEQKLFTIPPKNNEPTLVAIWWPWGHGSTLSLRFTMLSMPYEYQPPSFSENPIIRIFQKAKRLVA